MTTTDGGGMDMEMPDPAATEATAIAGAIATAKAAVEDLTAESSDSDVADANTAIMTAHNAITGAEHASAADTANSLAALDAVRTSLTTAQTTIDDYRADLATAAQAATDAKTKEADTKLAQITMEAEQANSADAGLGGSDATIGTAEDNYSLEIEYGSTTVTVHGATDDDDVEFVSMDLGGGLTMNTRDIEAVEADPDASPAVVAADAMQEVAMVMTDIEAPTPTAFDDVHELDVRADGETATLTMPADALNVVAADLGHVKASAFTAPAGTVGTTVLSFQQAVADNANTMEDESLAAAEIMGTYEGAMGTYKCAADGAACTVTVDNKGTVSAVSNPNDWIFIPATGAEVDVADTDYLYYGFWLKRSTDAKDVVTYNEVETFAGAMGHEDSAGNVTGSASYSGDAVGVYVHHRHSEGGGKIASSTAGHFTADASLKAYFGQPAVPDNNIPPNMVNTVTGTISKFMLSGGETNDWSVALEGMIDLAGGDERDFTGTAKGGSGDGDLEGNFYGEDAELPVAATGEFNAGFSNGAVAGAFGVNVDEE